MVQLLPRDGELHYEPDFIEPGEAAALFRLLLDDIAWQDEVTTEAGARVRLPRAVCWYGDPDAVYPYAGFTHRPRPWTDPLLDLRQRAEAACRQPFNGVLCNLYRDGREAMGWHADRETALGEHPVIASLSLGAERVMRFRHERTGEELELRLASGSLLLMGGSLQHHWQHGVPAMPEVLTARINLNFRRLRVTTTPDDPYR
jgi:alkylated DNA repair dioxygenase AlkB